MKDQENIIQVSQIKINFNEDNSITIQNDGNGITVKKHEKEKNIYSSINLWVNY